MSFKAIKENAFFDENDQQEIFDTQRELIDKFQKESDDAKENTGCLLSRISGSRSCWKMPVLTQA